jgi:hypothetical protein
MAAPKARNSTTALAAAVEQASALPAAQQRRLAETLLVGLRTEADPDTKAFQDLIEAKYARGLTPKEKVQLRKLEEKMAASEEAFYRPIIDKLKAPKKARAS